MQSIQFKIEIGDSSAPASEERWFGTMRCMRDLTNDEETVWDTVIYNSDGEVIDTL